MNGYGSSGTILRIKSKQLLVGASLWECLPCYWRTCGWTMSA